MITFVITFRNEGKELETTVAGLRETCGADVVIHLIDDASDDDFDYRSVAERFDCQIERFEESRGPAVNRNYGADRATTPYVMFLDAHMRFYEQNWHLKVIAALQADPEAIICTVSQPLLTNGEPHTGALGHGAIANFNSEPASYLHPIWNVVPLTHTSVPMIPVVLGANYAFTQDFFRRIGGYVGLKKYGSEEIFLSIKTWLFGGRCRLLNDVTIGHVYRSGEDVPWRNPVSYYYYNRLVIGSVVLPERQHWHLMETFRGSAGFDSTQQFFVDHQHLIQNLRDFVTDGAQHPFEYFYQLNRAFRNTHNLENYFSGIDPPGEDPKQLISIILPTYNNADATTRCIEALKINTRNDIFVIWIDNGSSDAEFNSVKQALSGIDYVVERHARPLGFAKAVNRGMPHVIGDYCAILNNDVEVNADWDIDLVAAVDDSPGLAGPMAVNSIGWQSTHLHDWLGVPGLLRANNKHTANWLRMHWSGKVVDIPSQPHLPKFRNILAFFCVLMPKHVLRKIGELDENFGWGFYEDDDYCRRARQQGYALSLCPGATVMHEGNRTMRNIDADLSELLAKNAEYLAAKWQNVSDRN